MALFGKKKKEGGNAASLPAVVRDISKVIERPVVTEKAAHLGGENIYAFVVSKDATKRDVSDAVRKLWNVVPAKVRMVNKKPRVIYRAARNRTSTLAGEKKAYVYLKKGDSINLV